MTISEKSSGNVFADLELPNPEVEQLRSALACEIFKIIERRKLKQRDAAKILGIDQPEVSKLKNGRFDQFSIERLMTFLNRLDQDVNISIDQHPIKSKRPAGVYVHAG